MNTATQETTKPAATDRIKTKECPVCKGVAILYLFPHIYAGIWECTELETCGVSDNCLHYSTHMEKANFDAIKLGQLDLVTEEIEVCDDCSVHVKENQ